MKHLKANQIFTSTTQEATPKALFYEEYMLIRVMGKCLTKFHGSHSIFNPYYSYYKLNGPAAMLILMPKCNFLDSELNGMEYFFWNN